MDANIIEKRIRKEKEKYQYTTVDWVKTSAKKIHAGYEYQIKSLKEQLEKERELRLKAEDKYKNVINKCAQFPEF